MSCPLCASSLARRSWLGALRYAGRLYPYLECVSCRSLYADPMPDEATVARMYGPEYGASFARRDDPDDEKDTERVIAWLGKRPSGAFIDYGCGDGRLLEHAARIGWRACGVEFDPAVAAETARRTGTAVVDRTALDRLRAECPADVLHLGDVIEHLTNADTEMPRILGLLRPGGYLIAQGPLEANATLFTAALKCARRLRGSPPAAMPPYHVMLATADGQRRFFERFGLREIEFSTRIADARTLRPMKVSEASATYSDEVNREELVKILEQEMTEAAAAMDFERAALLRDQLFELRVKVG